MDVQLTESYWSATPTTVDRNLTIGAALVAAARRWPDRPALVEGSLQPSARTWTFAELLTEAQRVARALLTRFEPDSRVAVWATTIPEWTLLQFGAALARLTLVTVNPAYGQTELEYVLAQSRAQGLFVEPVVRSRDLMAIAERAPANAPDVAAVVSFDDWSAFLHDADHGPTDLPQVKPSDPAQIQYTSGTTGLPKGALLAHRGLALNGRLYAEAIGTGPNDVWINPMPLFHTAGCGLATLGALQTGGTHVLPAAFDADVMLELLEAHRGTTLPSVPTMLIRMLEAQRRHPRDVSAWRLATLGGAPVPPELVRRAASEFGVTVAIGFGQTECSPYISHTVPDDPNPDWAQTVGKPLPLIEVKIDNPNTGTPTALGLPGEICTRSDCVMLEYFDDPAATAQAIDTDGWLHTGDIGTMDVHGYLRIAGRLKDLIIRGGENIYPREVEDVLFTHPAVMNVSVVGLSDDEWGEIVAAFVQPHPGSDITSHELETYCRTRIASYKVPRVWTFVDEFPQTSSGKIQKFVLQDHFLRDRAASAGHQERGVR